MSALFAERALLFAGECLLGSAIVLAAAWLATQTVRRASLRHLVWLAAFGALVGLPLAAAIVPPQILVHRANATPAAAPDPLPRLIPAAAPDIERAQAAALPSPSMQQPAARANTQAASGFDLRDGAYALFALWLAGALAGLGRIAAGAFALETLRRKSRPHALDLSGLPAGPRACQLRLSEREDGPITWGARKPVVLLPRSSRAWPPARLKAVLLHELAHVRRRDSLTLAMAQVVAALFWINPLVWLALRALRREAEMAADDAVLGAGMKPSVYAGELVQLASELNGRRLAFSGLSMAGSALEARVKSALAPDQSRTGVTSMDALRIGLFGIAATAALALARPDIVQAQDATPSSPSAVTAGDLPPPPPAPAAIPAPPAPPAPAMMAEPPVPPTPPDAADDESPAPHHHHHVHIVHMSGRMDHASAADMARAEAEMRQAQAELAQVGPQIEVALSDAKIDRKVAEALRDLEPRIRAELERALAKARPEIRKAVAEAHISEKIAKAIAEAQPRIDAAVAKMHANHKVRIEMHDEDGDDADVHADEQSDRDNDAK
ncbi:MAG: M56 family metallopeptidase [Alphaproteobacteria bacterium]|nr:M56 family metallopeptidase [Alphaproteobacteria bacterium]MBV9694032.1 M56 family metallopeptidase [Alphaproteobacteria bacterium]